MSYYTGAALTENFKKSDKPRQVVVLGAPRGGTSMVSGAIYKLGIDMGCEGVPTFEDKSFRVHKGDRSIFRDEKEKELLVKSLKKNIAEKDMSKNWGWKDPLSVHYLYDVISELPNPYLIYVWRSPMAVAKGEARYLSRIGVDVDYSHFGAILANINEHNQLMAELRNGLRIPSLHIDYEKTSSDKENVLNELIKFLELEVTDDERTEVLSFIR